MRKMFFTVLVAILFLASVAVSADTASYEISDITYEKNMQTKKPHLYMKIQNTGAAPVEDIAFSCVINGVETIDYRYTGIYGSLKPAEISEGFYDLGYCYEDYLRKTLKSGAPSALYDLDITLLDNEKNVIFQKNISINDLSVELIKEEEDGLVSYRLSFE